MFFFALKSVDILASLFDFNDDFLSFFLISLDSLADLFASLSFALKSVDILAALFDFNDDFLFFIVFARFSCTFLCFLSSSLKRRDSLCFCLYRRRYTFLSI